MQGLFITGNSTDVGKTHIGEQIIKLLNPYFRVSARKPVESDCIKTESGLIAKDATRLNEACTNPEPNERVCRYRYEACVSGEKASSDLGQILSLQDLVAACQADDANFVVVEGAGGFYSPIAKGLLNSDLSEALSLPVVLVIKDELGAVNQALMSLQAIQRHKLNVLAVVLNQISPNNLDNASAICAYTQAPVVMFKQGDKNFDKQILALIQQS